MCDLDLSRGAPAQPPPSAEGDIDTSWKAIRLHWQAAVRAAWHRLVDDPAGYLPGRPPLPAPVVIASLESLDLARERAEKRLADLQHAARGTWFK